MPERKEVDRQLVCAEQTFLDDGQIGKGYALICVSLSYLSTHALYHLPVVGLIPGQCSILYINISEWGSGYVESVLAATC